MGTLEERPSMFELLGFDFMVDENMKVKRCRFAISYIFFIRTTKKWLGVLIFFEWFSGFVCE